jgi:hypothetical protein
VNFCSSSVEPLPQSTSWSNKGHCYKNWPCKLHTIKDVPEGEQVLTGTFSLNGHSIIILFDLGASHDFINKACIQKCQLVIERMSTRYKILTLGGNIITQQLVINGPLNLPRKVYKMNLIVLDGQGIDVILGMS